MLSGFGSSFSSCEPELFKATRSFEAFLIGFLSSFYLGKVVFDFTGNLPKDFSI